MTNDIVALIEYYEREKQLERDRVVAALEFAFVSAYRKMVPGADRIEEIRASINLKKGKTTIFANLTVVADDDVIDKFNEVGVSLAKKKEPEIEMDQKLELNVTPQNFDRIAVQTAKQTMMQRLRMAEKEMLYDEFKDRAGEIVSGLVRRFEKSDVLVDLGKFEGRMPQRERVVTEDYNMGDRIRSYVVEVRNDNRGPEIILSRSHPNFVRRLPVGACVGLRGARGKNIVRELNNEKVDIIRWNDDLREFVTDALKPARINSINIDEAEKVIHVTVDEEDLSKAIGRRGQNARLTSRLLGWDVQVSRDESQHEQFEARVHDAAHTLAEQLEVSDDIADHLYRAGGVSVDMITQMPLEYIASAIEGLDADADAILEKAKSVLSSAE